MLWISLWIFCPSSKGTEGPKKFTKKNSHKSFHDKIHALRMKSRGIKRDKLKGRNGAKFAVSHRFSLIFADFRVSWELQHFGGADFRRKPQGTADFHRNPFVPFSSSLLIPPTTNALQNGRCVPPPLQKLVLCVPFFARSFFVLFQNIGRTPRGSCNRTLLRRVLRRFFNGSAFLEGFLEGAF